MFISALPPSAPVDPMDTFTNLLCIEGRFGGFWRRTLASKAVAVQLLPYRTLSRAHVAAAEEAAERYAAFVGLPLEFSVRPS